MQILVRCDTILFYRCRKSKRLFVIKNLVDKVDLKLNKKDKKMTKMLNSNTFFTMLEFHTTNNESYWYEDVDVSKLKPSLKQKTRQGSAGIWTRDPAHPKRESYP